MQLPIKIETSGVQSLQNQIFESIRQQILNGQLKSGMLMPSSRALSEQLGVSRNTVVFAFERLIAEDYLYSRKTVGTFVNASLPENSLMLRDKGHHNETRVERQPIRHPVLFKGRVPTVVNPNRHKLAIDFW